MTVHLGFEVGSGAPVEIPLAHTFVCGQTQLSGKTTTLRSIVERSGQRALAFVTKRGESFEGRRIRPYLPRRSDQPIHWRLVETMLASAVDAKNLKYERLWIINAAKAAFSLDDVQANVQRLRDKTKNEKAKDVYTLLDEYLELVLPQMRALDAATVLDLQPGLNVMDLAGLSSQTQAMVIRAALERINHHETDVLTVLPEAWEFAPRGRSAPAKEEAIAMARKGAAPKVRNFLLVDSQDIAGVDNVVRQACSVWLLGVQRELNELKRAIALMPASIVTRPKAADVATLEVGQFYACWGRHAVKVYVQPAFMDAELARKVARGELDAGNAAAIATAGNVRKAAAAVFGTPHQVPGSRGGAEYVDRLNQAPASPIRGASRLEPPRPRTISSHTKEEDEVNAVEARALTQENEQLRTENADLRTRLTTLEDRARRDDGGRTGARAASPQSHGGHDRAPHLAPAARTSVAEGATELNGLEAAYAKLLARLVSDARRDPVLLEVIASQPELQVRVKRDVIHVDGRTLRGRIARLIAEGFFSQARTSASVLDELIRRGADRPSNIELGNEMKALCDMGFFTRDNKWYSLVPTAAVNVVEG